MVSFSWRVPRWKHGTCSLFYAVFVFYSSLALTPRRPFLSKSVQTLVGASANLVTAGTAEHVGHKIGFLQFMKVGAPVVFITVTLGMTWCLVMYDVVGWNTTDTDGGLR